VKILVVDVGGHHVKVLASGRRTPVKIDSGPTMTARQMVADVSAAAGGWGYDVISIGFPGPVKKGRPAAEPVNLGSGWVGFDFARAFGRPVRMVNDAAMQALGSYRGGRMLFLGLGTGLGTALVADGTLVAMELAHLPYKKGHSYEYYAGAAGLKKHGRKHWRRDVFDIVERLARALEADDVVIGGGNVKLLKRLPHGARRGSNAHAFAGGYRLWERHGV
jgi:polyphosphate glucokinase